MSKKKDELQKEVEKDIIVKNTELANEPDNQDELQKEVEKDDSKKTFKLNVEVAFTDKYDETKNYMVGDVITVSKERFEELMNDPRKLVSENK